jgi:predicted nucleotide-binding protein (sugar kinase/HSP70/actin superfamily)
MKAARMVAGMENCFGVYISNFSCGPDSFILTFFREVMGDKPSLTLELDQHTADAGVNTRIEAFLDITRGYRTHRRGAADHAAAASGHATVVMHENTLHVRIDTGELVPLNDPRVEVVIPPMDIYGASGLAAVLRSMGIRAHALPAATQDDLRTGRRNTTSKECLPFIVCAGCFVNHLVSRRDPAAITLLFMATGGGPCRLGQYQRGLESIIRTHGFSNTAVLTISDENGYAGMGTRALLRAWQAVVMADVFHDIRSMAAVCASDPDDALNRIDTLWRECLMFLEGGLSCRLSTLLSNIVQRLKRIPLTRDPQDVPVISLVGEIFVRREPFSRKNIVDFLQQRGFMVKVAPVAEYMCYSNYVVNNGLGEKQFTVSQYVKMLLTEQTQQWWERRIKTSLAKSRLYRFEMIDVKETVENVRHLIDRNFRGECILTVGLAIREIVKDSCGVISIGPFGCMPSRIAESILNKEMNVEGKKRVPGWCGMAQQYRELEKFPFLAIETDGGEFSQITRANLESFILQARRTHALMRNVHGKTASQRRLLMKT